MSDPTAIAHRIRRWETEGPQGPLTLELYPTLRCNLRCSFCDSRERGDLRPPELAPDRLLALVDEAADLGVERVLVLGGGEPLAVPGLASALLGRVKKRRMEGLLTTNGTLLDHALATRLVETGWEELELSIDGPEAPVHDLLRGVPGAFRRVVRGACLVRSEKRRSTSPLPRLAVHCVLTRLNWDRMEDMVELAANLGATRIDFDALIAYRPEQVALRLTPDQEARLPEVAHRAAGRAVARGVVANALRFTDRAVLRRGDGAQGVRSGRTVDSSEAGSARRFCLRPWHHLVVGPDGRTGACCVLPGEGGSVAETPLARVWREDAFLQGLRKDLAAGRGHPRCAECSANILRHEAAILHALEHPWP